MGSGLILLVIVGASLAVLVPMGLRSHDSASARSSDRLGDAVRVLTRRRAAARSSASRPDSAGSSRLEPGSVGAGGTATAGPAAVSARAVRPAAAAAAAAEPGAVSVPAVHGRVRPAVRRRRVLLTLLVLSADTALAGLFGPTYLFGVAGGLALLAALFVVQCRRSFARARQLRRSNAAPAAPHPASGRGIGPASEPEPVAVPAAATVRMPGAATVRMPAAASARTPAATTASSWVPVPVPLPTYLQASAGLPRLPRVVDVAGAPARAAAPMPRQSGVPDDTGAQELDAVHEGRRMAGGW